MPVDPELAELVQGAERELPGSRRPADDAPSFEGESLQAVLDELLRLYRQGGDQRTRRQLLQDIREVQRQLAEEEAAERDGELEDLPLEEISRDVDAHTRAALEGITLERPLDLRSYPETSAWLREREAAVRADERELAAGSFDAEQRVEERASELADERVAAIRAAVALEARRERTGTPTASSEADEPERPPAGRRPDAPNPYDEVPPGVADDFGW